MSPLVESLGSVKAIVFDVYGTLLEIQDRRRPYAQLLQWLARAGRVPCHDDAAEVMSHILGLAQTAQRFGMALPASVLASLKQDLYAELDSVTLYPDARRALTALHETGIPIAVCSNLAAPYAIPALEVLPFGMDAYVWSFNVGAIKPDPAMYRAVCQSVLKMGRIITTANLML
ncbi:MAG: HAD family hydrolase [Candidimonas sp.]|nr:MAG: HAD family hydrolase [Candidimonas sp.]TAM22022.1 MAG: HAD family hydrolase [Candidimonas sp.]